MAPGTHPPARPSAHNLVARLALVVAGALPFGCASEPSAGGREEASTEGAESTVDPVASASELERRLMSIEEFRRSAQETAGSIEAGELDPDAPAPELEERFRGAVAETHGAARAALLGGARELAEMLEEAAREGDTYLETPHEEPPTHIVVHESLELTEHVVVALDLESRRDIPDARRDLACVAARFAALPPLHTELLSLRDQWDDAKDQDNVARRQWMYGQEQARAALARLLGALEELQENPRSRRAQAEVQEALHPETDALAAIGDFLPDDLTAQYQAAVTGYESAAAAERAAALETLIEATEALRVAVDGEYPESATIIGLEGTIADLSDLVHALETDGRFAAAQAAIVPRDDAQLARVLERAASRMDRVTALCGSQD